MTGEYPRATDTFIQREVAALRALGHHVQTFSVRTPLQKENVGAEILAGRKSTIYLLPPRSLMIAHLAQIFSSPRRYFRRLGIGLEDLPSRDQRDGSTGRVFRRSGDAGAAYEEARTLSSA